MLFRSAAAVDFNLESIPEQPLPGKVLFASPDHFDVAYVINPHMEGQIGEVDTDRALEQWEALRTTYSDIGIETATISAVPDFPDLVFCANQTLPYRRADGEGCGVVLSRMYAEQRRGEVEHVAEYFESVGYETVDELQRTETFFEGMGDAIWHPGRRLLWGGWGYRTDDSAYRLISDRLDVPIIILKLTDPDFYHLDTCFCPLDESTVMIYPGAFSEDDRDLIGRVFDTVIESPENDSRDRFSCNAHCPDGYHVIIQRGSEVTNRLLVDAGYVPVEVDTDEYLKSGGSVFCMKQMYW